MACDCDKLDLRLVRLGVEVREHQIVLAPSHETGDNCRVQRVHVANKRFRRQVAQDEWTATSDEEAVGAVDEREAALVCDADDCAAWSLPRDDDIGLVAQSANEPRGTRLARRTGVVAKGVCVEALALASVLVACSTLETVARLVAVLSPVELLACCAEGSGTLGSLLGPEPVDGIARASTGACFVVALRVSEEIRSSLAHGNRAIHKASFGVVVWIAHARACRVVVPPLARSMSRADGPICRRWAVAVAGRPGVILLADASSANGLSVNADAGAGAAKVGRCAVLAGGASPVARGVATCTETRGICLVARTMLVARIAGTAWAFRRAVKLAVSGEAGANTSG